MSDNDEDKIMKSEGEDNTESDDSEMDDCDEELDVAKLSEIEEKIQQNPFDYQAHMDKIVLLKAAGELVIFPKTIWVKVASAKINLYSF